MKGIIVQCAIEMVKDQFGGIEILNKIFKAAGIPGDTKIIIFEDVPDEMCLNFIQASARILNTTEDDFMLAFGDYWINVFAYKKYRIVFSKYTTVRDFLFGMDATHAWATQSIEGAMPPRFIFEETENGTLFIHYLSPRKLDKIVEGLLKGLLRFFNEKAMVEKIPSDKEDASCAFKITFHASPLSGFDREETCKGG